MQRNLHVLTNASE